MTSLLELAQDYGVKVIEDNAQALGAEYCGRKTGSLGDVGCLSFFPTKSLGGYGDGGMVVTNDSKVAERVRMLRTHGWRKKYYPETVGYNSRLDALQAAILRAKLRHLDNWNQHRRDLASRYAERLAGLGIMVPYEAPHARHVYHLYVVRVNARDRIQQQLKAEGIASAVYYPQPVHLTGPCRPLGYQDGDFIIAEKLGQQALAIPLYPEMSEEQLHAVTAALERAVVVPVT